MFFGRKPSNLLRLQLEPSSRIKMFIANKVFDVICWLLQLL